MRWSAIRAPALVGAMLIATVAGFIYMVSVIQTTVFESKDTYQVYAIFDDVTGLVINSNVNMVGIPVGAINSIERVSTEDGMRARVGIRVSNEVVLYKGEMDDTGILRGAASVIRKQTSILGDFFLAIAPGAFGDALVEGDEIPIVIGISGIDAIFAQMEQMGEVGKRLDGIMANVEEITDALAEVIGRDEGRQNLKDLVSNLKDISVDSRDIAQKARKVSGEIERLVDQGTFTRIADNIEATSLDAKAIASKLEAIVSAGDVEKLVETLAATAKELNKVGLQLNELVEEGITPRISQLDRIFKNFEQFSKYVVDFTETNSVPLAETLNNFKAFSSQLVALLQRSEGDVETAMSTVKGTLLSAQLSLQKMDESLENIRQITGDLREGKGTVGRLLTDDRLVEQIEEIVEDTKSFVKSYTLMQTEVQLASSYFILDRSFKNVVSLRFRPKEDKYYLLQVIDDPRGNFTRMDSVTTTNAPGQPPVTLESKETKSHDLKFSFQFAKQFYFLVGRFGIMENSGGIGLDFTFFKDRLQFQFDLFDFTMNNKPRLRSIVEWEIFRHFIVSGGVDDLMNKNYRDFFFSAGMRFTDDDLKALLIAAPSISP
jgi:phospholipid/cholesterol/gamma-HCH transport system substrate-binding protein